MRTLAALLLALCLCACASKKAEVETMPFPRPPAILWVDWNGCTGILDSPSLRAEFLQRARQSGFSYLAFESPALLRPNLFRSPDFEALLQETRAAGLGAGVVHHCFFVDGDLDTFPPAERAVWKAGRYQPSRAFADGDPMRSSPAADSAIRGELRRLAPLMDEGRFDFLLLTGAGFHDLYSDISDAARRSFQRDTGLTASTWPEDVLGSELVRFPFADSGRGPLWEPWIRWRALRTQLFLRLAQEQKSALSPDLPLGLLTDAPYQAHYREGINWAHPGAPAEAENPWLPENYSITASGGLIDFTVLGFWEPELTAASVAEERGYAWWASIEGAGAIANRYAGPDRYLVGAVRISEMAELQSPGVTVAERLTDGILILPGSVMFRR